MLMLNVFTSPLPQYRHTAIDRTKRKLYCKLQEKAEKDVFFSGKPHRTETVPIQPLTYHSYSSSSDVSLKGEPEGILVDLLPWKNFKILNRNKGFQTPDYTHYWTSKTHPYHAGYPWNVENTVRDKESATTTNASDCIMGGYMVENRGTLFHLAPRSAAFSQMEPKINQMVKDDVNKFSTDKKKPAYGFLTGGMEGQKHSIRLANMLSSAFNKAGMPLPTVILGQRSGSISHLVMDTSEKNFSLCVITEKYPEGITKIQDLQKEYALIIVAPTDKVRGKDGVLTHQGFRPKLS
jgi:hypothetical protein